MADRCDGKGGFGLALTLVALTAAGPALAQGDAPAFAIPAKPIPAALVDFAIQGRVSISDAVAARCHGLSRPLYGRFRLREGLERLLAGSGCAVQAIDARSFKIVLEPARPRPPAPPHPSPAPARAAQPSPPTQLGEVVVTATRRPTRIDRSPYAIGVITADQLRDSGVADTADLPGQLAGVTVTNLGTGRDKILIRGLSDGPLTGRTQSTVGIYLDDIRVTYNAPDPDLRLTDVERVEVLRGPQGSLYGAGSIGGILHIVTRQPELGRFSGFIAVTGSATEGGAPSSVVEGAVNLPIGERIAVRLVGYADDAGGYIDNVRTGQNGVNRTTRNGQRLAVRVQLTPAWTATAGIVRQAIFARDTQYGDADIGPFQRANLVAEPHDNDFNQAYLSLEGAGRLGRLVAATALVHHDISSTYDATAALPEFAPLPPSPSPFLEDDKVDIWVNELTLSSNPGGRLQWLAGAFYSHGEQDSHSQLLTGAATTVYQEDRTDRINEAALYGELSYALLPRLTLTAGGRVFRSGTSTTSDIRQPLGGGGETLFQGRLADKGLAPKLVASWRFGRDRLFYVQAVEGYRSGGFNTSGLVGQVFGGPGGVEPFRRFSGDELWNYEAGAKFALFRSHLFLRAAAFYSVWTDIQTDQLLPSGLPFTANIGDGRVRGVELESTYRRGGLTLRGNLLINNPELVRPNPAFPSRPDTSLPGVPSFSYGAGLSYERPLGPAVSGVFDAEAAYVGPSTLTFDAATAPRMGGYSTIRVSAGAQTSRWRIVAFIDNLADAHGDTFAYGNPFTLRLFHQITPQRPRTFGLTLSRSY